MITFSSRQERKFMSWFRTPEGHFGPHVSDEKCVFGTKNGHFLKLCQEQASYHIFVNMFHEFFDKKQFQDEIRKNTEEIQIYPVEK